MTASVPSKIALATSVISARVGSGFSIMDSSICVAVMMNLPAMLALVIIIFWATATCTAAGGGRRGWDAQDKPPYRPHIYIF